MNRSVFTIWLPATIITICIVAVVNNMIASNDVSDISDLDQGLEVDADQDDTQQDSLTELDSVDPIESEQPMLEDEASEEPYIDQDEWENSGSTVGERLENYNFDKKELPPVQGRMVLRETVYQKDLVRGYTQLRDDGLENNGSAAWGTLQFTPEMIGEQVTGIKLNDVGASEFLEKHGLENADVIREVNGSVLDSPEAAFNGMNTIGESDNLILLIDRGGEMLTIEIDK